MEVYVEDDDDDSEESKMLEGVCKDSYANVVANILEVVEVNKRFYQIHTI